MNKKTIILLVMGTVLVCNSSLSAQQKKALKPKVANQTIANSAQYWFKSTYGDYYGIKSASGKVIKEADELADMKGFSEGIATVSYDEEWGFIDKNNKIIIPIKYKNTGDFSEGLVWVEQAIQRGTDMSFKTGFIDKTGKTVIQFKYDDAKNFSQGLAAVNIGAVPEYSDDLTTLLYKKDGNWAFIDKTGKPICDFKYWSVNNFKEEMAQVTLYEKYNFKKGFINRNGEEVIPPTYEQASDFSEGLTAVILKNKVGYIDKTGKIIIPFQFDGGRDFHNGFAVVNKGGKVEYTTDANGGKYAVIDKTGKLITDYKYDVIKNFGTDRALVGIGVYPDTVKYGYIDKQGKEILPLIYSDVEAIVGTTIKGNEWSITYSDNTPESKYYRVTCKQKMGVVDSLGKVIIPIIYEEFTELSRGYYKVTLNNKIGVIDSLGTTVLPIIYDEFKSYYESDKDQEFRIRLGSKYGYINKQGQIMILPAFDDLGWLNDNKKLTYFKQGEKFGYVDRANQIVVPAQYEDAGQFAKGIAPVKLNGKYGYINETGKVVIPMIYDEASDFSMEYNRGKGAVKLKGVEFNINTKGERVK